VGLARFAYTPLLPVMHEQTGLSNAVGGWLATINYAGYMLGAVLAATLHNTRLRYAFYRFDLIAAVIGTAGMGLTENVFLWGILRFIAGVASAGGILLAAGLVLTWLIHQGRRAELSGHFMGMGLGIVVSGVAAVLMAQRLDWASQWLTLGAIGLLLFIPAWLWMPTPSHASPSHAATRPRPASVPVGWLLLSAYFCAGVGYVISATFLVAIVTQQSGTASTGNVVWIVVGVAATLAVLFWGRCARWLGDIRTLLFAYVLQIFSLLLPLYTDGVAGAMVGAILYGATFPGIVSLTAAYVGRRQSHNPSQAIAKLTLSYGIGQIVAPAVAGMVARRTGTYSTSLWLAVIVMMIGVIVLAILYRRENQRGEQPA
jgi:predicted MFS family arabinose efflux permease